MERHALGLRERKLPHPHLMTPPLLLCFATADQPELWPGSILRHQGIEIVDLKQLRTYRVKVDCIMIRVSVQQAEAEKPTSDLFKHRPTTPSN